MSLFPTLTGYQRGWLRFDVLAGLAAGAVVIPQAMAYATIAQMPVQIGLYTCMVPMLVYAVLGGSRTLSVSTSSTVATLTASTLLAAGVAAGSVRDLATLVFEVGAILLVARLLRVGALVENISQAVLVGVKTGVGLTVAVSQLPKLLGLPAGPDSGFFRELGHALTSLGQSNPATVLLSAAILAVLLGLGRIAPRVPAPLVAVVGAIISVTLLDLPARGVALIEPIPEGLPVPAMPAFDHAGAMLPGAFAIALMVFLESLSVARGVRGRGEPQLDNDRELFAAAAANTAGAFFSALPAAGGFSQTAVNAKAGARTQASQLVTVALAVVVALWLAPALDRLPQAALAALVLVATLGLVKPAEFARLARINRVEFWLAVVTAGAGLTMGLLAAVAIGVIGTLLLVLRELNRPDVTELRRPPGGGPLRHAHPDDPPVNGMLVLRLGSGLYTANVRANSRAVFTAVDEAAIKPQIVLLDATVQTALSVTVLDALRELDEQLSEQGVTLWIAGLPERAITIARHTRWWPEWEADGRIWPEVEDAARARSPEQG